jgi:hypothetical protein
MATYVGVHVRMAGRRREEAVSLLEQAIRIRSNWHRFSGDAVLGWNGVSEWVEIRLFDNEGCSRLAEVLSGELGTEAVCLIAETTVDALAYWRFSEGEEKRRLVYGMNQDREWEVVSGTPDAWEDRVLWRSGDLDSVLARLPPREAENDRRVYEAKSFVIGQALPFVDVTSYLPWIGQELGLVTEPLQTRRVKRPLLGRLMSLRRG